MKKFVVIFLIVLIIFSFSITSFAADTINIGDSLFVLMSSILVFLMIPGLALFYGGMVKSKNVINTIFMILIIISLISLQWIFFGYTLSFGTDIFGIIGGFNFLFFNGVEFTALGTIPHIIFAIFQMMFAIITPALIVGAIVERTKLSTLIVFVLLWSTLVYNPLAHWIWGGGWLMKLGMLDFAGGNVVHISAGFSGLIASIVIGKRNNNDSIMPNNVYMIFIGTAMLWIGWFGFNAGSALAINSIAISAFLATGLAAASALLSWITVEYLINKKLTLFGACTGSVVGLVAITPAAGFVSPIFAIIIGLSVSPICYFFVSYVKHKFNYDDTLDTFGCHGIGGIWGAIATGLFANSGIYHGLFFGNPWQLIIQLLGILVTLLLSGIMTYLILKIISFFTSLRVNKKEEILGLDIIVHGEEIYN